MLGGSRAPEKMGEHLMGNHTERQPRGQVQTQYLPITAPWERGRVADPRAHRTMSRRVRAGTLQRTLIPARWVLGAGCWVLTL